ncbi:MAG: hypothetical protein ACI4R9_00230 [Kiritimatiellia bacterium]
MNTYECEISGKIRRFRGVSALDAIERMERKYRWNCHVKMFDADTRGEEWAHGYAEWTSSVVPEWFTMYRV